MRIFDCLRRPPKATPIVVRAVRTPPIVVPVVDRAEAHEARMRLLHSGKSTFVSEGEAHAYCAWAEAREARMRDLNRNDTQSFRSAAEARDFMEWLFEGGR